jgi:hypothetical protein
VSPVGIHVARTPRGPLYRIGRAPNPLDWPPREFTGANRFDDPLGAFRVLYAARQRVACFAESLAPFRPALAVLAREAAAGGDEPAEEAVTIPLNWLRKRAIAQFRLGRGRWLDLRVVETFQALRPVLARQAAAVAVIDIDLGSVAGPRRDFTQAIARWAYEQGYHGIAYKSRLDHRFDCWAVFDTATIEPVGDPEPLRPDDPDLGRVAALFRLALTSIP